MASSSEEIAQVFTRSVENSSHHPKPYDFWELDRCLPDDVSKSLDALPYEAPDLGGESGTREAHNATRQYFDKEAQSQFPVVADFAKAFQSKPVTDTVKKTFGADIAGCSLRIEYAMDTGGFYLNPHTDLGVKRFTMLLYLSDDPRHSDLGTDIYDNDRNPVERPLFGQGRAVIFVPSNITWHGFEARTIKGVRKSIIINYVTPEWRAREQLAFPDEPIQ